MEKISLNKTKLSNKYAFWFKISKEAIKNNQQNQNKYESQFKKISEFATIEDFWAVYQHLKKPDNCDPGIELHLFKESIKPLWEDESNKNGGKLIFKCNKGYTSIIWEEIILRVLGGLIPKDLSDNINGIKKKKKKEYNILEIWFKEFYKNYCDQLEQYIREDIQIPKEVPIDFKKIYNDDNQKNKQYKKSNYNLKNYNDQRNYSRYHNNNYYYNKNKNYNY